SVRRFCCSGAGSSSVQTACPEGLQRIRASLFLQPFGAVPGLFGAPAFGALLPLRRPFLLQGLPLLLVLGVMWRLVGHASSPGICGSSVANRARSVHHRAKVSWTNSTAATATMQ